MNSFDDQHTNNAPFSFEQPEDSPGFLLWQTTILWQRQIKKALDIYGVSHVQFVIMAVVLWFEFKEIETTQILITTQTKLDKMTISKALKKLVNLSLINRVEHTSDTRAKSVTLTDTGKHFVNILMPIIDRIDNNFFGSMTILEERKFNTILLQLIGDNNG